MLFSGGIFSKIWDWKFIRKVFGQNGVFYVKSILGRDVDDDADVAFVLAEADVVAVDVLGRELVDRRRLRRVGWIAGRLGSML
jgi:hypothetical protein